MADCHTKRMCLVVSQLGKTRDSQLQIELKAATAYQSRNFWFVGPKVTIVPPGYRFSRAPELKGVFEVVLLILESLGSTELLFILVMALIFFGPRKLPQISRTLGKNLAEFRRASEDFKRTWEREVNLEEFNSADTGASPAMLPGENSILDEAKVSRPLQPPTIGPVAADQVIPRQPVEMDTLQSADATDFADDRAEPSRKRDWL